MQLLKFNMVFGFVDFILQLSLDSYVVWYMFYVKFCNWFIFFYQIIGCYVFFYF